MALGRLFHTPTGKIIVSIILGLGIASLFRKACKDRNCIKFEAPSIKELEKDVYRIDDKCYKYKSKTTTCDKNKKTIGGSG
jgi:hypothetical protein